MVPIKDDNPISITPFITYGLIIANVLVFIYEISLTPPDLERFFQQYSLVPLQLTQSFDGYVNIHQLPENWTLITSQFLHGSFLHVGFNMLFLWIFGNNIEEALGHWKFFIFYLACGVLAALSQWFFSALSPIPSLGASGAIAGVMGAYILKYPQAKVLTLIPLLVVLFPVRIPAVYFLGFWFLQQAFNGVASLDVASNIGMQSGGVAYWAHAGGFIFGFILGPLFGLFSDRPRR